MFKRKGLEVSTKHMDRNELFGIVSIPTDPNSLTSAYLSSDWRDGFRLTFLEIQHESIGPFLPGLVLAAGAHSQKGSSPEE